MSAVAVEKAMVKGGKAKDVKKATRAKGSASVQMNVRMDATVKARGDEVLRAAGYTPSEVVRVIWEQMAQTGEAPEFLLDKESEREEEERRRRIEAAKRMHGLAYREMKRLIPEFEPSDAPLDYGELRERAWEEKGLELREGMQ